MKSDKYFCNQSSVSGKDLSPIFFIGSSPSLAQKLSEKADGVMISVNQLRKRCSDGAGNGQGRRSKWKNSPTVPIRVPEKFAEALLEIAQEWDDAEG